MIWQVGWIDQNLHGAQSCFHVQSDQSRSGKTWVHRKNLLFLPHSCHITLKTRFKATGACAAGTHAADAQQKVVQDKTPQRKAPSSSTSRLNFEHRPFLSHLQRRRACVLRDPGCGMLLSRSGYRACRPKDEPLLPACLPVAAPHRAERRGHRSSSMRGWTFTAHLQNALLTLMEPDCTHTSLKKHAVIPTRKKNVELRVFYSFGFT